MKRCSLQELFLIVMDTFILEIVDYYYANMDGLVQRHGRYYNNRNIYKLLNVLK